MESICGNFLLVLSTQFFCKTKTILKKYSPLIKRRKKKKSGGEGGEGVVNG